jgi:hypothetical protein
MKAIISLVVVASVSAWATIQDSASAPNRILIIGYGQSNMGVFFSACDSPCTDPNPPNALPNTYFYSGGSLGPVTQANGIRVLQNNVTAATGLPTVSFNCSVGGSAISGLVAGTAVFNACAAQVNSIITPRDKVFIIWDQGEGDANGSETPTYYATTMVQLHKDFVAAIGRTTTNCPWLTSQKGTASSIPGSFGAGTTQLSWQTVKNGQIWAPLFTNANMIYSHTDMDFWRGDGYHYEGLLGEKYAAQRYAQSINTMMGVASPSGFPNWGISGTSTVDATHTTVALTHTLGTDFTPSSGGTSFEVSGDNGATWINAVASRTDATHISLLHSSISTKKDRLVRYLYGFSPPDADINCVTNCSPPTAMIFDNSSLKIPLSPTTWDLRPTPLTTLPMPTWRDIETTISVNGGGNHTVQTVSGVLLGPDQDRKMLVLAMAGIDFTFSPLTSMTLTPQDYLGNNVGSQIIPSLTPIELSANKVALFSVVLGASNAAATTFKLDMTFIREPFSVASVQVYTVPFADLNSSIPAAHNKSTTTSTQAITTTLNTSAGGFINCIAIDSAGPVTGTFTGSVSGTVLTANASSTPFVVNQSISGQDNGGNQLVKPNTVITSFGTGTGGAGTYNLNTSNTVPFNAINSFNNRSSLAQVSSSTGEKFAVRRETGGIHIASLDASNSPTSSRASATITFNDSGNLDMVCASWR